MHSCRRAEAVYKKAKRRWKAVADIGQGERNLKERDSK
jgi:hypothetical protein